MRALLSLTLLGALACTGCDGRGGHADDALYLTPSQAHDVFVAADGCGPQSDVIVLATVPAARYEGGAIVLTGGRELEVVQPQAWRVATGTALATEEAERTIARAARIDAALTEVGEAAAALRASLTAHAAAASATAAAQQAQAAALQEQRRAAAARARAACEERIAGTERAGAAEVQDLTTAMADRVSDILHRYAGQEAAADAAYRADDERLRQAEALDAALTQERGSDAAHQLVVYHRQQRADLEQAHARRLDDIHVHRDDELQLLRTRTARAIDDTRRLTEARVERLRQEEARQLAEAGEEPVTAAAPPAPLPQHPGAAAGVTVLSGTASSHGP